MYLWTVVADQTTFQISLLSSSDKCINPYTQYYVIIYISAPIHQNLVYISAPIHQNLVISLCSEGSQLLNMDIRIKGRVGAVSFWFLLLLVSAAHSFDLPGVAPRDFARGDELQVNVRKLSSMKTQLPYDYYYLQYCRPRKIKNVAETLGEVLGEVLWGDRIENSVYTFRMREAQPCTVVCRVAPDAQAAKDFKEKIDDEYRVNMILDNIPVAVLSQRQDGNSSTTYEHGFHVGFKGNYARSKEERYFIHNHLSFRVMYHEDQETNYSQIVGFEVTPISINHVYKEWDARNLNVATCNKNTRNIIQEDAVPQEVDTYKEIIFTYDVTFKESEMKWASRN